MMKLLARRPMGSVGLSAGLAVVLVFLASLQYRWIGRVSEAERERREISLQSAVRTFRQEFYTELLHVCLAFRLEPRFVAVRDWQRLAGPYEDWKRFSARPELVFDVLIWEAAYQGRPQLLRIEAGKTTPEPARWPPALEGMEARLASDLKKRNQQSPGSLRPAEWTFDGIVPALLHPLIEFAPAAAARGAAGARIVGYEVVVLDAAYLETRILPELVDRHFRRGGASDCMVEIADSDDSARVIYRSDPSKPHLTSSTADLAESLIGEPLDDFIWLPASAATAERPNQPPAPAGVFIFPEAGRGRWRLLAKFRAGSLDAQVAALRLRNLAVSFGVLLLLAISAALVIAYSHRAQRLAKLQMDFVAGVSHELRTPLAVISAAADNLADGVVQPESKVKRYGETIRRETRRLSSMVEQILLFAADKAGRRFELRPVDLAAVIDAALADEDTLIESAGISVEKDVEAGLPRVAGNDAALKRCLENLISNAVKYGGGGRWLGIKARMAGQAPEYAVQVTVADRGMGMDDAELHQIFQPFYRGRGAQETMSHGTGLGLSLVKDTIEAINGRITVESTPGRGSAFTLHLQPARDEKT